MTAALERLSALSQETRLSIFRRLVEEGPTGLAAGALAEAVAIPAPTLSFHVAQLERAGLVKGERYGRSIVYTPIFGAMQELVAYLYENCCQGSGCAPPTKKSRLREKS